MANLVTQIKQGLETSIETVFPTFEKLDYQWQVEKNSLQRVDNGYAVLPLAASTGSTRIIGHYTIDQTFQVVLGASYESDGDSDEELRNELDILYTNMDDILKDVYAQKLGLQNIILLIDLGGYEDPEVNIENKNVYLRMNLNIRYRRSVK